MVYKLSDGIMMKLSTKRKKRLLSKTHGKDHQNIIPVGYSRYQNNRINTMEVYKNDRYNKMV